MLTLNKAPTVLHRCGAAIGTPDDYTQNLAVNRFPDLDITVPANLDEDGPPENHGQEEKRDIQSIFANFIDVGS